LTALLAAHFLAAALAPLLVKTLGRRAFLILAAPPAATIVWALTRTSAARTITPPTEHFAWVPSLSMELSFRLDALSWLMVLVVGAIGALVLIYCAGYFDDDEPGLGRFAGSLTAFAGAMLGLVTSDDLLVLYVFWELTTVLSYLLIGHRPDSRASRSAATQALVVTTAGGLAMFVGAILLGEQAGTYRVSELLAHPPDGPLVTTAVVLLLVGALSKSALLPFHFWLPGAMAAPTPVSAYLHAAAMVKAGVYLVARFAPGFADTPLWRPLIFTLGGATMLLGAWRALRQHDLKLLLAFGTVSQLGFLTILVGTGTRGAALAGLTLLLAHALFKACLFLVVGAIDRATGTRDLRQLSGLRHRMPLLATAAALGVASMAAVPPLLGFVAKEAAYATFLTTHGAGSGVLAVIVAGSMLTVAYSARFLWGAFRDDHKLEPTPVRSTRSTIVVVPALLAALSVVGGLIASRAEPHLVTYAQPWPADQHPVHLSLWHGVSGALILSMLTLAGGAFLFLMRTRVAAAQRRIPALVEADSAYRRLMRGLDRASLEITGASQRGSLPLSLGLILLTLIVLPGGSLLLGVTWPSRMHWWDGPVQMAVALLISVAAIWTARSRRQLRGVMLAGVVGYGTAVLFLLHGAPDLALTQVLVETVLLVVFILVLRRLPGRFSDRAPRRHRRIRIAVGALVGLAMSGMAITAAAVRTEAPASADFAKRAV
jgi:multicomponent Na+:H+ antiporter subunit A